MQNIQFTDLPKDLLVKIANHLSIQERHQIFGLLNRVCHLAVNTFVKNDQNKLAEEQKKSSEKPRRTFYFFASEMPYYVAATQLG